MNTKLILFGFFISVIILVYSLNFSQSTTGPHGGELKQAANYNIEMRADFPNLYFYLLNQKLAPVNNKGITCEVSFLFPDQTSIDLAPKPFEDDGFVIESSKIVYNSCRVTFNVFGKSVSALFQKENMIVNKK